MRETQETINTWIEETFGTAGSNISVAARANVEMAELLFALAKDDNDPSIPEECADVAIVLMRLCARFGVNLFDEIDRKMTINRGRKWSISHGHGQHIEGN